MCCVILRSLLYAPLACVRTKDANPAQLASADCFTVFLIFYAKNLYFLTIGYAHYIARSVPCAHRQCARFRNIQGCANCLLVTGYGVSDCSHVLLRSYQDGDIIGVRDHFGLPLRPMCANSL